MDLKVELGQVRKQSTLSPLLPIMICKDRIFSIEIVSQSSLKLVCQQAFVYRQMPNCPLKQFQWKNFLSFLIIIASSDDSVYCFLASLNITLRMLLLLKAVVGLRNVWHNFMK
jgi:hypothetical protein